MKFVSKGLIDNKSILVQLMIWHVFDFNEILDEYFWSQLRWLMAGIPAVKLSSEECH